MKKYCSGCGESLEECNDCKESGYIACCPDCKHGLEKTEMNKYIVIQTENFIDFQKEVNKHVLQGYKPQGAYSLEILAWALITCKL